MEYVYSKGVAFDVEDVDVGHAVELYVVSDRYQELGLRSLCKDALKNGLRSTNVLDLLRRCVELHCDVLKDSCIRFLYSNIETVLPEPLLINLLMSQHTT
jgi:hypothetical protein